MECPTRGYEDQNNVILCEELGIAQKRGTEDTAAEVCARHVIIYQQAEAHLAQGQYRKAAETFALMNHLEFDTYCFDMADGLALYEKGNFADAYELFSRYSYADAKAWAQKCIREKPLEIGDIPFKYRADSLGWLHIWSFARQDVYLEIYRVANNELVHGLYLPRFGSALFDHNLITGRYRFIISSGSKWFGPVQKFGAGKGTVFEQVMPINKDGRINGNSWFTLYIEDTYLKTKQ